MLVNLGRVSMEAVKMSYQSTLKQYLSVQDRKGYPICILCHQGNVNEFLHGPFQTYKSITAHSYCLLFASGLCQRGNENDDFFGFLEEDVLMEARRGSRLTCSRCKHSGATVGCTVPSCRKSYHYPCGVESQMLNQFFGQYNSFCIKHQPKQAVPSNFMVSQSVCMICQEKIGKIPNHDTLWASCCKKAWFHRACLQKLALSAGRLFKCPVCSDSSLFCNEMKTFGIFASNLKASWEMEESEFELFVGRHKSCDKEKCLCPQGRDYNSKQTRWELRLCTSCGSKGTHVGCAGLNLLVSQWDCEDCKPNCSVASEGKALPTKKRPTVLRKRLRTPAVYDTDSSEDNRAIPHTSPTRTGSTRVKEVKRFETTSHNGSSEEASDFNPNEKRKRTEETNGRSSEVAKTSRNVAKRSSGPPGIPNPYDGVRFIIRDDPDETWVFFGRKEPNKLRAALENRVFVKVSDTEMLQHGREKQIWVWCPESSNDPNPHTRTNLPEHPI